MRRCEATQSRRRYLAAVRTIGSLHACDALRLGSRARVVRIGGGSLDPDVSPLEELAFPDRRDLLHPLDGVAAGRKGIRAMRRGGCDCDAGVADFDSSNPMMQRQPETAPV